MSEKLPAPDFDSGKYERPNQAWLCGRAAEGNPCRSGPDHKGRCGATAECTPVLEKKPGESKGRWRCTRTGGACESGPLPDGSCGRPIPRCSPVPTLRTIRGRVTRGVIAATAGVLLILLGVPAWRDRFVNPGELSAPHSGEAFARMHSETNRNQHTCAACHVAGASALEGTVKAAMRASPGPFDFRALTATERAEMTAIDASCQKCHTRHLLHQPGVVRDISCSFCHLEHQGPGPMRAATDMHCAFCHGDPGMMAASGELRKQPRYLGARSSGSARTDSAAITTFAADHPEFRVHTDGWTDPNTLKFGHALHLTGETIPRLPNGQALDCASCHQPDASGIYFKPVDFESHCRACHSLQFDPETPALQLPHGNPDFVSAFLRSLPKQYADQAAASGITGGEAQAKFVQDRLRRLQEQVVSGEDLERRIFFSTATLAPAVQVGTVSGETRALYPGCVYCHEVKPGTAGRPEITKPVQIPRWLESSRFDHSQHTMVGCAQCHDAAQSKLTADIILPGKETCITCHSPRGGVRDSCTTCHSYHDKR